MSAINSSHPDIATAIVKEEMGLDDESTQEFLAAMIASLKDFRAETDARSGQIACRDGVPRAVGDNAFKLLEAMDDARAEIAEHHFVGFQRQFADDTATSFREWLQRLKLRITHVTFNHKELALKGGQTDVDDKLFEMCAAQSRIKGGARR